MQKGIFLQDLNTKSRTVNNAIIQLGDIDDSGKGRKFVSKFIQPGLVKIEGHGIVLLRKETLDESLPTIVGSPVIIQHKDVTEENADELRCGVIANAYFNEPDGWYYVDGIIWDDKAQELINKGWSVSCSYDFLAFNDEGGEENNIHYDKEFTQLNFTHLAIVDNPRYERANIVFNSKDEEKGTWITIKGNHIFIPDGKTLDEVIKEKGWGDKENKQSDGDAGGSDFDKKYSEIEKLIKDKNFEPLEEEAFLEDLNDFKREYDKNLEPRQEEALLEELADFKDKILDKYPKFNNPKKDGSKDKQSDSTDKNSKIQKAEQESKSKKAEPEWLKQERKKLDRQTTQMYEDRYSVEHPEAYKKNLEEAKNNFSEGNKGYSLSKEYKNHVQFEGDKESGGYPRKIHKDLESAKKFYEYKKEGQEGAEKENLKRNGKRGIPVRDYPVIVKNPLGDGYIVATSGLAKKHKLTEVYPIDRNKAKNSKEQDMALLDELKKLIFKVENQKENKMDSKSKILSILNEKEVDKETIEEIKNELEKIEEKEEDKKVDNEDEKEEDKKVDKVDNESDEDKEKAEDLKEDEKKDVENKCKNSVGNAKDEEFFDKINKIYNSAKKIEEPSVEYESKQARLDAGKEYFG